MLELGVFVVPDATNAEHTLAQIEAADAGGLDLVGIQDHPYQRRFYDTWTLLSWAAARTTRIKLVPDVICLPLRPPAVLGQAAASLDLISGGRLELGLGAGGFWDAIAAMGGPRRSGPESVDALEEAIPILRGMWSGARTLDISGQHYSVHGLHPGPPPAHPIGIWLGAYGPRMLRITGRLADAWLPSVPRLPYEELPARHALIDEAAKRAGRDPGAIRRVANATLSGLSESWRDQILALHTEHRFDGLFLGAAEMDPLELTRRLAEDVAPAVREALG